MSDNPQIIWEKWRDPYGNDDLLELENIIDSETNPTFLDDNNQVIDNEESSDDNPQIESHNFVKQKIPFMFTPMGIIPYTEYTAAGSIFNFWTGHTNFNLSKNICDIIENTDGIETLDIFTRYRFRVGIGKCFVDSIVMRKINKNIYQHFLM